MTQNEIEKLKELIGNNCEWNDICAVGQLLDLLQDEKNSRERLMEQNKALAKQVIMLKQAGGNSNEG